MDDKVQNPVRKRNICLDKRQAWDKARQSCIEDAPGIRTQEGYSEAELGG